MAMMPTHNLRGSMARERLWVGLDVGADDMVVCGTDDQGRVIFEQSVPTTAAALDAVLRPEKRRIKLIGLESGSQAIPLTRSLRRLGYRVAVYNARQSSKFLAIRQNKTDRNDARGLADIARLGRDSVSEVRVKSKECQRLRSMLVTRQKLVRLKVALDGALRSLIRLNGGKLERSANDVARRSKVATQLKLIRKREKIDLSEDVEAMLTLSEALGAFLTSMDSRLSKKAADLPVCRNFLAIPGVGPICALSFYSAIDDPARFKRNADVGPYLGMVPIVRQSGQSTSRRRISKMGDPMTRSYLSTAALVHLRFAKSALSQWGASLAERRGKRQAQIAVGRKLAVLMLAMWKSNEPYDARRGLETSTDAKDLILA